MGKGMKLTKFQCGQVSSLRERGLTLRKISDKIGKSVKCVYTYLKNPQRYMQKSSAKRPTVTSATMGRRIIRTIKKDQSLSSSQLKSKLSYEGCPRTIRRYLNKNGFKYLKKGRVPLISARNKRLRNRFANKHKTWNEEWRSVIFSDEKKFNLDGPDGNKRYWHDLNKNKRVYSRRPSGGGGIMVWGAISWNGKLELKEISGRMNAEGYVHMLANANLKQEGERLAGLNWKFQQDNAPCHSSRRARIFFEQQRIDVLDWPANSPDLNIIENAWGQMARDVYKGGRQFQSIGSLRTAISSAWENISQEYLHSLYNSMKSRIAEVLLKRGDATSY